MTWAEYCDMTDVPPQGGLGVLWEIFQIQAVSYMAIRALHVRR